MPNNGDPTAAATPWNINKTPKAFVSNSRPVSSTIMVDLKDAKQANKKNVFKMFVFALLNNQRQPIYYIELNMSLEIFYSSNYQFRKICYSTYII